MSASEPFVVHDGLYFPECFRWRDGELWFSDMFDGVVYHRRGMTLEPRFRRNGALTGGLGWLPDGRLLAVAMDERKLLAVDDGIAEVHADLSGLFEHPTNDMYVTAEGRAYVSGYGFDADNGAPVETVRLAIVEADGAARLSGPELTFPNGIDRLDASHLFVAESFADRVTIVELGPDGSIVRDREFAVLAERDGPDGIAPDGRGGLWVACAFGMRAVHLNADGTVDDIVEVPGLGVYDCTLTPDGGTLLLATASTDEPYAAAHATGAILGVDLRGRG